MKNSTLYKLCSQNNWFTHGTSLQYRRMFDLNADGVLKLNKSDYALDALARIIWICSDESISYDNIKDTLFVAENEEMGLEKTYSIDELTGTALEKALAETKEAEFDNEDVDRQTLIDYNRMTGCRYDVLGEFISYSWRRDCERL